MFTLLITDFDFLIGGKLIDSATESLKVILPLTRILTTKIYIYSVVIQDFLMKIKPESTKCGHECRWCGYLKGSK